MLRHRDGRFMFGVRKPARDYQKRCAAAKRGWATRRRHAKFFADELARQLPLPLPPVKRP